MQDSYVQLNTTRRLLYGVVFEPNRMTSHGHYIDQDELVNMAHTFMQTQDVNKVVDIHHLKMPVGASVVESFIARKNDPDFPAGAWVLGIKIHDNDLWQRVLDGEIKAFSATVLHTLDVNDVDVFRYAVQTGRTSDTDNHSHVYWLEVDPETGEKRGVTDVVDGHYHVVSYESTTNADSATGRHTHAINIAEANISLGVV